MSLVREALAKAEREAAARAARERGLPPERTDLAQPYRAPRRRRWPWAAGLVLAALAGAGVAYVVAGSRETATPPRPGRSETPPPPDRSAASNGAHGASAASPVPPASSVSPPPPTAAVGSGETETKAPAAVGAAAPVASTAAPPSAGPDAEAAPASGTYAREVALGGGRAIRLGGIAWSETAPVAYLNGRLRGVGEVVDGWEIVEIGRDRVTLAEGARRVEITLR